MREVACVIKGAPAKNLLRSPMHSAHTLCFLGFVAVCSSGCSRLAQFDAHFDEIAKLKTQVASLQNQTDGMSKDLSNLNTQLVTLVSRANELEALRRKSSIESQADTQPAQIQLVESAIASCLKQVREFVPEQSHEKTFWTGFDAYFNLASGKVRDNVTMNGQLPAKFAFNKCTSARGVTLN